MRSFRSTIAALALLAACGSEPPPGTEIYLVSLDHLEAPPRNLTGRPGYDNQPFFSADGGALYYTRIEGDQADIHRLELASGHSTPITASPESEYSPTPMPGRAALSVIRVEADERQRLWAIPLDGSAPEPIFPDLEPVGYHAWGGPGVAALFVLGEPITLQLTAAGGGARVVAENVGRALVAHPARPGVVAFVAKHDPGPWRIHELDTASGTITPVTATLPQREDFTIGPDGAYWMGAAGTLYRWRPGADDWLPVADFSAHGIRNITRLAIDPAGRRLALVADESP